MNAARRRRDVGFTLDVLTDGSEYTGCGSIFLSVWKKSTNAASPTQNENKDWLEESMALNPPLCRYAITGIGDLTARLAADQRFKLASTRAVFSPTFDCLDGLSALLLALHSAGAPSLHLVTTKGEAMEELATIVLGTRRNMNILNCQVPNVPSFTKNSNEDDSSSFHSWWQVYDDEHLVVHASRRHPADEDEVTYLFSMYSNTEVSTLALIPPKCECVRRAYQDLLGGDLPLLQDAKKPISIDAILALNPRDGNWNEMENLNVPVLATLPDNGGVSTWDTGVLIKSQQVVQHLSKQLPRLFPKKENSPHSSPKNRHEGKILCLSSCTSVLFDLAAPQKSVTFDRRNKIWGKPLGDEWASTVTSLKNLSMPHGCFESTPCLDENEIDLDDEETDGEEVPNKTKGPDILTQDIEAKKPQLYVLGTGCATPSAIRGASGYALSFPRSNADSDIFIVECGEGVTTMLSRYGPDHWLNSIRGIWISHSHLDHYGGLPTLLRAIANETDNASKQHLIEPASPTNPKRQKTESRSCCWVMAPPKVLRYLDVLLDCRHGRRQSDGRQLFDPLLHHDPTIPTGPWNHFRNIKVPHNCFPAYALLIGWTQHEQGKSDHKNRSESSNQNSISWFCFSGDTRPSDSLVRTCRATLPPSSNSFGPTGSPFPRRFFLLHEATFEDGENDQAERKKHSTVSEAMMVARDIGPSRVLLTHFSQRYISLQTLPAGANDDDSPPTPFPVGLAMDGLQVPLE